MGRKWDRGLVGEGFLFAFVLALAACSSGGGSGNDGAARVTITGSISSGSGAVSAVRSFSPGAFLFGGVTIDHVVGFQVCSGGITAEETAAVDQTGNFSFSIVKGGDGCGVAAMLLDSTEPIKIDQVKGFISVPTLPGAEPLIGLPSAAAQGVINLGAIDEFGNTAKTTADLSATLGMTNDQLTEVARVDSVLRNIKNTWANQSDGIYYQYSPGFEWGGSYLTVNADGWTDLASYFFKGTQLFFRTNDPDFIQANICPSISGTRKSLQFLPPSDFAARLVDFYGADAATEAIATGTGFTNGYAIPGTNACSSSPADEHRISGTFYLSPESGAVSFNWGGGGVAGDFPEGTWTLRLDDLEKAWFDVKIANPLDANNKPLVYVPSFKVQTDANGKITSVLVSFHLWDGINHTQVTDTAVLLKYTKSLFLALTQIGAEASGGNEMLELRHLGNGEFQATPTKTFCKLNNSCSPVYWRAESISLGYSLFGLGVRFDMRSF